MARIYQSAASLRFRGDDLDPDELTRLLGQNPTQANRKGDPRRSGTPNRTGGWHLCVPDREPGDLDDQIRDLLSGLTTDLGIWAKLSKYRPDLFCGLFMNRSNEGFSLSPATLKMIADRQIEIGFDVYGPSEEE